MKFNVSKYSMKNKNNRRRWIDCIACDFRGYVVWLEALDGRRSVSMSVLWKENVCMVEMRHNEIIFLLNICLTYIYVNLLRIYTNHSYVLK